MSADLFDTDVWHDQPHETIRTAARDYRRWADDEERNGWPGIAARLRRHADQLDRLYGTATVEVLT